MRRRRSPARWLAPIALVACAVAVYSVVNATLLSSDEPRDDVERAQDRDDGEEQHGLGALEERASAARRAAADVHRQVRRHAVVDLRQDRRLARAHPGAQPEARLPVASDRPAGQALAVTAAARRAAGALVVALALLAVAVATRRRAAPARGRRRRPDRPRAGRDPRRARDGRRRLPAQRARRAPGREHDEAHDRAAHARAREALDDGHGDPLPRRAGRVRDRPAGRRAHDGRRPHARPAARQRERRRRDARRPRRRHARALRAPDEPPRPRSSACATRTTPTRSASTRRATTRAPRTSSSSR